MSLMQCCLTIRVCQPISCDTSCPHLDVSDCGHITNAEFLKVTVSRSCDRAKFVWLCSKSWDLYAQTKNLCSLTSFTVFFFMFYIYHVIFCEIFVLFVAQNFKTKVLTAKQNLRLECLNKCWWYGRLKVRHWGHNEE